VEVRAGRAPMIREILCNEKIFEVIGSYGEWGLGKATADQRSNMPLEAAFEAL